MALVTNTDVEKASGKDFDGNSIPTADEVDTFCIEAQAFMEDMLDFEVEEVTETDVLLDVDVPTKELIVKYPIKTWTKLEERTNDTYEEKTKGPTDDYTVDKVNGIIKATSSFGCFEAGPERYRLNYIHGLASTDKKYTSAKRCVVTLAMIAVIGAEQGGSGSDAISSFSVGGLSVSYKGDEKQESLWEDAVRLIKVIRGEWRPFGNG